MKKILICFWGLAITLSLTQCNNKLNEPAPQQSLPFSEALNTPEKLRAAVVGIYGIVRGGTLFGGDLQLSADLMGGGRDMRWRGTFQAYRELQGKNMVAENGIATATWVNLYNAINACNNVLENLNAITDAAERDEARGHALLWRGVCYFELVRLYAQPWVKNTANSGLGVPLMLKANNFEMVKRNTIAEVYTQVLQDLTQAETLLPVGDGRTVDYPATNAYYATKYTAKGFLARAYLQQGDYANALTRANDVITSNQYSLNATVNQVFDIDNTPEAIFEIQQNITNNAGIANAGLATFYANLEGIGRGDVEILSGHLNEYIAGVDKRRTDLFYVGTGNRPGRQTCAKWKNPNKNYNIMRLSEMYLIRAECNFELASTTGDTPLNDINRIRTRAGVPNLASLTIGDILKERRMELCFEGHRIHDLKRRQLNVISFASVTYPYDAPELVFPIPRREMNANPNMVQNPGY